MKPRAPRLAWAPPLLVGACAAVAAEVAMGLLLYSGPGLVRSFTAILGVSSLAFAGGLWTAPATGPGVVDRLRRRWLACLTAFLVAAVFGVAWSLPGIIPEDRTGQAAGLVLLAALPLFTCGSVLGGISAIGPQLGGVRTAAPAALGACVGFVLTGALLPRAPLPASLLLMCLVLLSLGGMVYGALLGRVVEVRVADERPSPAGSVRVEERRGGIDPEMVRVLVEGDQERARVSSEPDEPLPWDVAVGKALLASRPAEWSLLFVGGGASGLANDLVRAHPSGSVHVLERTQAVVDLGREHLETALSVGDAGRVRVAVGNLEDLVKGIRERYDAVLVDADALASVGGPQGLSREARGRIVQAVVEGGVLVWGPAELDGDVPELAAGWQRTAFEREGPGREPEVVTVLSPAPVAGLAASLEGFMARNGVPADR